MRISIEMRGTTPLMIHNEQLADPTNKYVRMIKEYTAKGVNQTDSDREQIARLEWQGGLYLDADQTIVVPVANIIRCLRESASQTKQGKKIIGAIIPIGLFVPLIYDGPTDLEKLYASGLYTDARMVRVGRARIKRVRPKFPKWALKSEFELETDILNPASLEAIVDRAGRVVGLLDGRTIGFGRFEGSIIYKKMPKAA